MICTYAGLPNLLHPFTLTTGCFDALHVGHLEHLQFCKSLGGSLVVCVGNDETVHALKGVGRPIIHQRNRSRLVAALYCVDIVVISEESGRLNFLRLMELLRPDKLVVSADDLIIEQKRELCARMGVEMVIDHTRAPSGASTTAIVTQILETSHTP